MQRQQIKGITGLCLWGLLLISTPADCIAKAAPAHLCLWVAGGFSDGAVIFRDVDVTLFYHLAKQEGWEHWVLFLWQHETQCSSLQISSVCIRVQIMLLLINGASGTLLPAKN